MRLDEGLALIHSDFAIPKELYDKLRNSKDPLSNWVLGSPYALPDNAPEEAKEWAKRMRKGLLKFPKLFQEGMFEGVADDCLPVGLD